MHGTETRRGSRPASSHPIVPGRGPRVQLTLRASVHDWHPPILGPGQRLDRWLQRQAVALRTGHDVPGQLWAGT